MYLGARGGVERASSANGLMMLSRTTYSYLSFALAIALALFTSATTASASTITVHPKFGGQILGYDVDQNGTEGVLSEFVDEPDGTVLAATETFDQSTGAIVKVLKKTRGQDDFATQGLFGKSVGLVLFQHNHINSFLTANPLSLNVFNGTWTPPVKRGFQLGSMSSSQGSKRAVGFESSLNADSSFVFATDVAQNTFGKLISLAPILSGDEFLIAPTIAFDNRTDSAILADSQGCPEPICTTDVAIVDLSTGTITEFTDHLGIGTVDGLAVDPASGIAVTTTLIDQGVEFYDLAHHTGFEVTIPNAGNALEAGLDVEFDALHKVFLTEQYSSTGDPNNPQARIYVYDERGNVLETIPIQRIGTSPGRIAIDPRTRTGFLDEIVEPQHEFLELQSFSY